jgi:phage baseplate assembly protein W
MTELGFPYGIDGHGRTAGASEDDHIRELIEQLLLTAQGERVNRPSFGAGLLRLIQEGMIAELSAATQTLVLGSVQATLGELIDVSSVAVEATDTELQITLSYRVKATGRSAIATVGQELV